MKRTDAILIIIFIVLALLLYGVFFWEHTDMYVEPQDSMPKDSGRAVRSPSDWKTFTKPNDGELKNILSPMQYQVTQQDDTEPAFHNEYHDTKEAGIYVDVVSSEPLFASVHKYDSGTGWASFWDTVAPENIVKKNDFFLIVPRTEVRSKHGNSHLGHVFLDGPKPTGLRYCMNSAALRFVPKEKMAEEGYGEYVLFLNE